MRGWNIVATPREVKILLFFSLILRVTLIFFFLLGDVTPFRISVVAIAANQQNPGGFDLTYLQRSCGGAAGAFDGA